MANSMETQVCSVFFRHARDMLWMMPGRSLVFGWAKVTSTSGSSVCGIEAIAKQMDSFCANAGLSNDSVLIGQLSKNSVCFFIDDTIFDSGLLLAGLSSDTSVGEQTSGTSHTRGTAEAYHTHVGLCKVDDPIALDERLLAHAGLAMWDGLDAAEDTVSWYDESLFEDTKAIGRIKGLIHQAIVERQMVIYLQPVYECRQDGRIVGAEALVRWQFPQYGLLLPNLFLPVVEKVGMIADIDMQVLDEVCLFQAGRLGKGEACVPIAVNLSRETLLSGKDIVSRIVTVVDSHDIDPGLIQFELLEGSVNSINRGGTRLAQIATHIGELRQHGFKILLDDYGTGASNIKTLLAVPFDILKFDKEMVSGCVDPSVACIVRHLVLCMKELGREVIGEGVETLEQLGYLEQMGCECAQGFLLSHPLPTPEFARMLDDEPPLSSISEKIRAYG